MCVSDLNNFLYVVRIPGELIGSSLLGCELPVAFRQEWSVKFWAPLE